MTITAPKLILFDMDETLGCSRSYVRAMEDIFAERGLSVPDNIRKKIEKQTVLKKDGDRILSMGRDLNAVLNHTADDAVSYFRKQGKPMEKEAYLVLLEKKAEENVVYQPYEGAKEFIDKLRQQGIQVGFVTDSVREHAIKALTSMGVYNSKTDALVDRADISDDPTPKGNNRQAAIQKAVAHYGVKPDRDVWYVGNDSVEIEDAMKLGCTGIGYGVNTRAAEWAEGLKEGSVNSMYDTPISRDQLEVAPTYKSLSTLLEHSQKMGKSSRTPGS